MVHYSDKKGGETMEYKIKEQKHFEDMVRITIKILSELNEEDRHEIFNYIIYKYNDRNNEMED